LNPPTPHLLVQNSLVMASFATLGFEFRLQFSAPAKEASSFLSSSSTTIAPPPRQQWCRGGGGGGGGRRRRSECRLWQCLERSLQSYRKVRYQEGLRAAQAKNSNARAREEEEEAGEEESGENECEKRVFMFGMGYTCIALANTLQKQNWIVAGTCRSDEKVAGLQSQGFQAFHFNPDNDGENLKSVLIFLFFCPLFSLFLPQFLKEQFTNHMDFVYLLCASMTKFTRYVKARLQAWRHLVKLREILRYHVQFVSHLCEYTFMWQRECSTRALCCYTCLELNSACGRFQRRPSMLAAHVCDPSN
jgi:hypothetical protein